ncbi:MAG TPA: hypothetical protein PLR41_00910 [Alphaproteobacteria bacterium]|nr:hypothetical protein [Alphaproteobacteria bacterium]
MPNFARVFAQASACASTMRPRGGEIAIPVRLIAAAGEEATCSRNIPTTSDARPGHHRHRYGHDRRAHGRRRDLPCGAQSRARDIPIAKSATTEFGACGVSDTLE